MSVAIWPTDLPRPLRRPYSAQPHDLRRARQGSYGPPSYERASSARIRDMALSLALDPVQRDLFWHFFEDIVQDGIKPFWMPDPTRDGWQLYAPDGAALQTPDGQPLERSARLLCIFGSELPSETLQGQTFTLSFRVVVLP
ncbi:MAG: hypothetical protein N4A53_08065 [Pelagimonas sp.]|jgi:hypothetical protein|nr:hypothetical protein [Pelagimonas sp.]